MLKKYNEISPLVVLTSGVIVATVTVARSGLEAGIFVMLVLIAGLTALGIGDARMRHNENKERAGYVD